MAPRPFTPDPAHLPAQRLLHAARKGLAWAAALGAGLRLADGGRLRDLSGPLIVLSNHGSRRDSAYYIHAIRRRITVCGARPAYFSTAPRRALMALMNVIPATSLDTFVRDCRALLDRGEVLLLYPEMATHRLGMGPFRTWAAEVALRSRAPVLPCYIHGTTLGHRGPVTLVAGAPFAPDAGLDAAGLTGVFQRQIGALAGGISP